eukprot:1155943-Pelagomonas_calceolata.AAC.1
MKRLMVPAMRQASSRTCVPYVLFMVKASELPNELSTCVCMWKQQAGMPGALVSLGRVSCWNQQLSPIGSNGHAHSLFSSKLRAVSPNQNFLQSTSLHTCAAKCMTVSISSELSRRPAVGLPHAGGQVVHASAVVHLVKHHDFVLGVKVHQANHDVRRNEPRPARYQDAPRLVRHFGSAHLVWDGSRDDGK